MRLRLFRQKAFRNLSLEAFHPPPVPFAVVGGNAQGKTSLLLGVHLLLGGEVRASLADLVRFGEREAWLYGEVETELGRYRVEQRLFPEGREIRVNERAVGLKGLWELPGSVLLLPEDVEVVLGPKEERRGFLDRMIGRFSRRYAALLSAYEKVLRQRNALLKAGGNGLSVWDRELARYGTEIMAFRRRFLRRFLPTFQEVHRSLAPGEVGLALEESVQGDFLEALEQRRPEELLRGQTLLGPHRDDLVFLLAGRPAHRFASRGEAKALAMALRLAEHRLLWEHHGEAPLLLVDEWSEELDPGRRKALLTYAQGLPQAILAGLQTPEGMPVCSMAGGVVLCPGG
ncbi:MAG: DNA replication and repair protein RecF [Thermus sp.]|uniref:DNA replication/repair protein RecF n=1 Tax=Thermus sp. TaxID=275 RepID=UPI0025ECA457|nr:DNA replication and repair protein RecF [Thermus sp.]MCS6869220.1 DNA replication and repair protein RecF [Thermus sp.]MCS7217405.1 DNA replication and repair protein RecF [Thermus sp.]MDW8017722.1 DNA replication and repair protein RecF [Thermus sp.]MDW8357466.1 DNA replication and repair protein RecF [Thermus sp.]